MKTLDVGCGSNKFEGSVGVDVIALPGVDVVTDLNKFPWPFKDNEFDRVIFKHSISHFSDVVGVMEEVSRISKNNAVVEIIAPHFSSDNFHTDPTHKASMGFRSMYYFCTNVPDWKYKYSRASYELVNSYIGFSEIDVDFNQYEFKKRKSILKMLGFEKLVNMFPRVYEKLLAFSIPANVVYFKLIVKK